MDQLEVCSSELGYVTAVDQDEGTFFVQLTKFTNKELEDHNKQINKYCTSKFQDRKESPSTEPVNPKVGDVLCSRYAADGNWYRVVVKACNDITQQCRIYFADYGNLTYAKYGELIRVHPSELETITRPPFGFYAKIKEGENVPDKKKLLHALSLEYILIKTKKRLDSNLWLVELPNVAYNHAFLDALNS